MCKFKVKQGEVIINYTWWIPIWMDFDVFWILNDCETLDGAIKLVNETEECLNVVAINDAVGG